jgi:hypothetical protein
VALPTPAPGLVISYAYLWRDELRGGADEGRKDRPCAIVLTALDSEGDTGVYVAPITHSEPSRQSAIEMPPRVKARLGMDAVRSWIVAEELNRFVWPGFDLRPISRDKPDVFAWGFLPVELFKALREAVADCQRQGRLRQVDRR